jgi:hypothetical protein
MMKWVVLGALVAMLSGCMQANLEGRIKQVPGQPPQYEAEISIQSEGAFNDLFNEPRDFHDDDDGRKELTRK